MKQGSANMIYVHQGSLSGTSVMTDSLVGFTHPTGYHYYPAQVSQLLAPQLAQEPPPPMAEVIPLPYVEQQAKADTILAELCRQRWQGAASLDWLIGRFSSNFTSHLGQTYSYIGIAVF